MRFGDSRCVLSTQKQLSLYAATQTLVYDGSSRGQALWPPALSAIVSTGISLLVGGPLSKNGLMGGWDTHLHSKGDHIVVKPPKKLTSLKA